MKYLALLLLLTLAACGTPATVAQVTPVVQQVLPAEAQRIIDQATATAGAVVTAQAVRTQEWQATVSAEQLRQQALIADGKATAEAVKLAATQTAIPATAQAIMLAMEAERRRATETAEAEARRAQATLAAVQTQIVIDAQIRAANLQEAQYRAEVARQADVRWSNVWDTLMWVSIAVIVIGGIGVIVIGLSYLDALRQVHIAKIQAESVQRYITRSGNDILVWTGAEWEFMRRPPEIEPPEVLAANVTPTITPITPITQIPVEQNGEPLPPIDPRLDLVRRLLLDAIAYAEDNAGWPPRQIPGHRRLHWNPNQWQTVVTALAQYLTTSKAGTFCTERFASVGELLDALDGGVIAPAL